MIGVSLPLRWLADCSQAPDNTQAPENVEALLRDLRQAGVDSIELRSVQPGTAPETVLSAGDTVLSHGFSMTVHGAVKTLETAVSDVFVPLSLLLPSLERHNFDGLLTVTIHPINGDNAAMLRSLADHIQMEELPVRIALENNRLLPDGSEGDSAALVCRAVCDANSPFVGICFDMGHYLYHCLKTCPDLVTEDSLPLPDPAFMKRVIHTHIHAVNGLKTHFPLKGYRLPLRPLLNGLSYEYYGVYNLELDFPRFEGIIEPRPALLDSVSLLYDALPHCARLYRRLRFHFTDWMMSAGRILSPDGVWMDSELAGDTAFGFVHATSYIFRTCGMGWAMDIAFRYANFVSHAQDYIEKAFSGIQYLLLTHEHIDHLEEETTRRLSAMGLTFVLPEFVVPFLEQWDIPKEQMIVVQPGVPITLGPLQVLPFPSQHYRPGTANGVPELGYIITTPSGFTMAFPGDVRDYRTDTLTPLPQADVVFSHIWMGDESGLKKEHPGYADALAAFALHFSAKNIILAHLYENGRMDKDMWRLDSALEVKSAIHRLREDVNVIIPRPGEVYRFSKDGIIRLEG